MAAIGFACENSFEKGLRGEVKGLKICDCAIAGGVPQMFTRYWRSARVRSVRSILFVDTGNLSTYVGHKNWRIDLKLRSNIKSCLVSDKYFYHLDSNRLTTVYFFVLI